MYIYIYILCIDSNSARQRVSESVFLCSYCRVPQWEKLKRPFSKSLTSYT